MTDIEKFIAWHKHAERDLDAARAMFHTGRWFYVVFMCQQAVEKLAKGLYTLYIDDNVPRTHNIGLLLNRFEDCLPVQIGEERYQLFETLSKHYLADRYPAFADASGEEIDGEHAKTILSKTEEVFAWLLTLKTSNE